MADATDMKALENYQQKVGSQNDKANRRIEFADNIRELENQNREIVLAIKADYIKTPDKVTDEEAGLNFKDSDSLSAMVIVEKQILAAVKEYEDSMTRILDLLPANNR